MNRLTVVLALALLVAPGRIPAQEAAPPIPNPAPSKTASNDIFSGTVTELTAETVTVERTALLRDTVKRTFLLDSQTIVEGKLRAKARVTVRYATDENGQFHALHIIVR